MGCECFSKNKKSNQNNQSYTDPLVTEANPLNTEIEQKNIRQLAEKRNAFIDNFFNKNFDSSTGVEKSNTIFIKSLNKKMKLAKDIIIVEEDLILKVNLLSPNSYFNSFGIILDESIKDIISKEIYIDDVKVDDSKFQANNYNMLLQFENTTNQQTRKVKVILKIKKPIDNYGCKKLFLDDQGISARFLIYADDDITIDDISNKQYTLNKELNLAYFEGITTSETNNNHGFIYYSKNINYQIYRYIPEFTKDIQNNIIRNKELSNQAKLNFIAKYKKVVITEYGQDVEEINLMKVSNYAPGQYLSYFSVGLYMDEKNQIDLVELNGKPYNYQYDNYNIKFNNCNCYNNQFIEIHLKYKYFTNEERDIYRQENVLISDIQNSYCKSIVQIPDNYIIISTKDIFQQSPEINNRYFYQGIPKEEKISELFLFCFEKAKWEIDYEYYLEAENNIKQCDFSLNRLFKGGNLKEIKYDIIMPNANLTDSTNDDRYIFNYNNVNTNRANINFKVKVENSTSNYIFNGRKELLTQIPNEEVQFFKNLVNQIIAADKTNYPDYKKIGKWVHNYITYNLQLKGRKMTAMEIYNIKQGVCEHYTKLYNTLLTAYGIDAIKVCGYAKNLTENNAKVLKKKESVNINNDSSEKHAWTLAKIDGEWVPLDATWDLFEKKVPITHIFQNYGDSEILLKYNADNKVSYKLVKENINYIK